jgi:hypothetical protein
MRSQGIRTNELAKLTGKSVGHLEAVFAGYPGTVQRPTQLDTVDEIASALGLKVDLTPVHDSGTVLAAIRGGASAQVRARGGIGGVQVAWDTRMGHSRRRLRSHRLRLVLHPGEAEPNPVCVAGGGHYIDSGA